MKKGSLVVGLLILLFANNVHGQRSDTLITDTNRRTIATDTLPNKTKPQNPPADVLKTTQEDTSVVESLHDTIIPEKEDTTETQLIEKEVVDTVEVVVRDTVIITRHDTITRYLLDVMVPEPRNRLDSAIAFVQRHAVMDTSARVNKKARQAFQKLLHYARSQPADSTMQFMEDFLEPDTTHLYYSDTTKQALNDSLDNYLEYIWDKTRTDSIKFTVFNRSQDSLNVWLTENPRDSSRFLLYDDKDYPAGIWIYPQSKESIQLSFVEEVRIEEVEPQQTLHEILPVSMDELGLQKQKKIDMVFPQWDIDGIGRAHFNQGYISNWARGGESSLSTLWTIRYSADYKKGKTIWDNDLEYKVGLLKSGNKSVRKNEDKLEINSKFGTNARKDWYYSTLLNFQTQFFRGFDYPNTEDPISSFLAPAYLVFSVGMDYKPSDRLTILLSPISSKFTMMRDTAKFDQTNFGISKNKKSKKELGAYVKSIFSHDITERISVENKINLFINYLESRETLDVDYELTLNMELNEMINTTINTHLVYDRDISSKIQFKENLSVGLQYRF